MPDLVEKYFQEDLTEAEDQVLEDSLLASDEAAERLVAAAQKAYYRYGLPTPRLPGAPGASAGSGSFFKPWMGMALFALGAAALFWWNRSEDLSAKMAAGPPASPWGRFFQDAPAPKEAPSSNSPTRKNAGQKGTAAMDASTEASREEGSNFAPRAEGKEQAGEMSNKRSPEGRAPARPGQAVQTQQIVTPFNLEESPSRKYSGIAVEVKRSEPGLVSVRVLDMSGLEVTPLYNGNLATGRWIFEWDGQLGNGSHVKPGYYQVEVRSGSFVGRKNIHIK